MANEKTQQRPDGEGLTRIPTGIPGLDTIVGGGLVNGAIYLVMGRPGAGKTTLANQLCFAHVARGGKVVYVTLLAESHASMVKNLSTMSFFEPAVLDHSLIYVSAYRALKGDQLHGLFQLIRRVVDDHKPSLLVLDGVAPARSMADTEVALKEFIVELQVLGSMTGCTTVLLANMTSEDPQQPEHTMVDGLIELGFERAGRRTLRTLEALKFRGGPHLLGRHELFITREGLTVYPRAEDVLIGFRKRIEASSRRRSSGIVTLDSMLSGGLLSGTTSVVLGFSGSGKTTLGLHFLDAGVQANEVTLYFGFYEPPSQVLASADQLGLSLRRHEGGLFQQIWQPAYEYGIDALAARLIENIERRGVQRLVIDGLECFRQASTDPERVIRFLTALSNELRARDVTAIFTDETPKIHGPEIELRIEGTSALADNLILLEYVRLGTELRRLISVVKQRSSVHASEIREFSLTGHGISISLDSISAEEVLSASGAILERRKRTSPLRET